MRSLPLQPAEAFLLSRVDGLVDERELALVTGLGADPVAAALDRLVELGAIEIAGTAPKTPAAPKSAPGTAPRPNVTPGGTAAVRGRFVDERTTDSPPLYDPAELDEPVELDGDRKRRILDLYYRLDELTYYELLGVPEDADKKQIKSAYYLLAPEFHPDKFFRKNLGSYRPKIEAVFARLTLAHDVLTSKQKRPEYDAYLEQTHRNRSMVAVLDQAPRDIAAVVSAVEEAAKAIVGGAPPDSNGFASPPSASLPPSSAPASPGRYRVEPDPDALRARREAFARKLTGGTLRPPAARGSMRPATPAPAETRPAEGRAAGEALRARYEAARAEATRQQVQRYVASARSALDRKDYASAANAYRIAASLAPADEELQRACAETVKLAAAALAEGFFRQADYEAEHGRWAEAALSYAKVCNGRPDDPRAHDRAAFATLMSSGNARRAVELARRAVELAPMTPDFRLTLARAYLAAGFETSARAEAERAIQLAPTDARVKDLADKLRA